MSESAGGPVGWWVKSADAALDAAFDTALEGTGVDRRGWQLLASLARGPLTSDGVAQHRALAARVADVRARVSASLPPEDYATLVALLERLVTGLRPT